MFVIQLTTRPSSSVSLESKKKPEMSFKDLDSLLSAKRIGLFPVSSVLSLLIVLSFPCRSICLTDKEEWPWFFVFFMGVDG